MQHNVFEWNKITVFLKRFTRQPLFYEYLAIEPLQCVMNRNSFLFLRPAENQSEHTLTALLIARVAYLGNILFQI